MTIVVGFVDTPQGEAAVETAIKEARLRAARLIVVHSLGRTSGEEGPDYQDRLDALRARLVDEGIDSEVHQYARGNTAPEDILLAAGSFDADLIVVGLRDRTRTGKYLLGSDAQDVLLGAQCPVLAVKAS